MANSKCEFKLFGNPSGSRVSDSEVKYPTPTRTFPKLPTPTP